MADDERTLVSWLGLMMAGDERVVGGELSPLGGGAGVAEALGERLAESHDGGHWRRCVGAYSDWRRVGGYAKKAG